MPDGEFLFSAKHTLGDSSPAKSVIGISGDGKKALSSVFMALERRGPDNKVEVCDAVKGT